MYFIQLLVFVYISKSLSGNVHAVPQLQWPEKYYFEATKIHLTAGIIERMQYWRTSYQSRSDYYNGAVKTIIDQSNDGVKFEIHPETNKEYENELKCTTTAGNQSDYIYVEDLLPNADYFTFEGNEILQAGNVSRFLSVSVGDTRDTEVIVTLWAKYDDQGSWIPVRFETIEFGTWLGNLEKHIVFDVINFNTDFSEEVFNIDIYDCTTNESVTKDEALNFIDDDDNEDERHADYLLKMNTISHNSQDSGDYIGINEFIDRAPEEKRSMSGLIPSFNENQGKNIPENFDLRLKGYITPVRDQLDCEAGWAISAADAVSGALAAKNGGRLIRLSPQAILDCAWGYGSGCGGANASAAYRWILANNGLPTELEYGSYANKNGYCNNKNLNVKHRIKGFAAVTPNSVESLKNWLKEYEMMNDQATEGSVEKKPYQEALRKHGPVTVSIDASYYTLQRYTGGILYALDCEEKTPNHVVTVVGYGKSNGEPYWIVKNSWGVNWGIDGYFFLSMRDNNCGILDSPMYPVVD